MDKVIKSICLRPDWKHGPYGRGMPRQHQIKAAGCPPPGNRGRPVEACSCLPGGEEEETKRRRDWATERRRDEETERRRDWATGDSCRAAKYL